MSPESRTRKENFFRKVYIPILFVFTISVVFIACDGGLSGRFEGERGWIVYEFSGKSFSKKFILRSADESEVKWLLELGYSIGDNVVLEKGKYSIIDNKLELTTLKRIASESEIYKEKKIVLVPCNEMNVVFFSRTDNTFTIDGERYIKNK